MKEKSLPTILIITHVIPFPPSAGNEIRILKMLKWLRKEGYNIVLLLNASRLDAGVRSSLGGMVDQLYLVGDNYGADFRALQRRTKYGDTLKEKVIGLVANSFLYKFFPLEWQWEIRSSAVKRSFAPDRLIQLTGYLCEKYDPCAVIAEYIFTTPCLDAVPTGVLKIVDTHDMFSRKKEQVIAYGIEDLLHCTPQEERDYLLKSDVIIAIQENEAEMFKKLVPERTVLTIGIDYDVVPEIDNSDVMKGTVLVVGSASPLNVHGLREFYKNSWPTIRDKNLNVILRIVGRIGSGFQPDDGRVQVVGIVDNLDDEYAKATVVINPVVAGTGLKIKSVEALCHAKPLVATPNGVEGLAFSGEPPFVVAYNWTEFAEAVLRLLKDEEKLFAYQGRALEFAKNNFGSRQVYFLLGDVLKKASQ